MTAVSRNNVTRKESVIARAESLVKGEPMYHSQIMGMNHNQVKESKSCDCCLHRFLSECTM